MRNVTKDVLKICTNTSFGDVRNKSVVKQLITVMKYLTQKKTNLHIICSLNCKERQPRCNLLHRGVDNRTMFFSQIPENHNKWPFSPDP